MLQRVARRRLGPVLAVSCLTLFFLCASAALAAAQGTGPAADGGAAPALSSGGQALLILILTGAGLLAVRKERR
ncbi:MAG TPA: hypothetical protein VGR07_13680 [Thermoanaerobaculia bacterium]|jgi:hypothetical protein|nr:hypothetical protein [Thermoanaerobaculia bacterium]